MKFTILIGLAAMLVIGGCSNGSSSSDGGTSDTDTDGDTDGDTDADTDSDTDTQVGCCEAPEGITDWGGPCHTTADCPLNTVCIIIDEIDQTQGFCAAECCNFSTANAEHCTDVAGGQEGCLWGMTSDEGITWEPPFYCMIICETVADCPDGTDCVDGGDDWICYAYAPATDAGVDGGP